MCVGVYEEGYVNSEDLYSVKSVPFTGNVLLQIFVLFDYTLSLKLYMISLLSPKSSKNLCQRNIKK